MQNFSSVRLRALVVLLAIAIMVVISFCFLVFLGNKEIMNSSSAVSKEVEDIGSSYIIKEKIISSKGGFRLFFKG